MSPALAALFGFAFLLAGVAGAGHAADAASADPNGTRLAALKARFAHPPADSRILKIIHGWPDQAAAQDQLIRQLKTQDFGGVVCNVSFTDYLESDAKWRAFTRAVRAAKDAGLALWLYDEKGYPSGTAGGLVLRGHPEWEAEGLLVAEAESNGAAISLDVPPGRLMLAAAYPVANDAIGLGGRVELADRVRDGKLAWAPPAGRWHVLIVTEDRLYAGTHAELNLHEKQAYPNLLLREPTARFLELTHRRYAERLGPDLGQWFAATFTDEPSLMSCFIRRMPYGALPWSTTLPSEFERRRGYALAPRLPALIADAGADSRRVRHDFWLTIGELVSENYFGQIQAWCAGHDIASGGHLLAEEGLAVHVPLYGDFFRCLRRLEAPGIDCLTSVPAEVPWHIARLCGSAAELEGRSVTMCETSDHGQQWRPPGDTRPQRRVTEAEIRGTCNRLFVSGVNTITSYYSFAGLDDAALRRLNEWVGRGSALLRGSQAVADIAVLYPIESAWANFRPSRQWANDAPGALAVEQTFRAVAEALFAARRDFTFVDAPTLAAAQAESGTLVHRALRWRVVVLPQTEVLPAATWQNLERFVRGGGVLIAVGALPGEVEAPLPTAEVFGPADDQPHVETNPAGGAGVWLPPGLESLLPAVLDRVVAPDVQLSDESAPLRVTHRRRDGREWYYLINDSAEAWAGSVSFRAVGDGERWRLESGTAEATASNTLAVALGPYAATAFTFARALLPERRRLVGGVLPGFAESDLPLGEPALARGEFVRADVVKQPLPDSAPAAGWEAEATLTKDQTDTWLFLGFQPSPARDLRGGQGLVLDTWVPAGQHTPAQLLVILREAGGGDFIAHTGRLLSVAGRRQVRVAFSAFQPAGWSPDANGRLDLDRIAEIRVGWGGYLGVAGERVVFRVAAPRIYRLPGARPPR